MEQLSRHVYETMDTDEKQKQEYLEDRVAYLEKIVGKLTEMYNKAYWAYRKYEELTCRLDELEKKKKGGKRKWETM